MSEISRSALFGRLNPTALKAIETATGFCKMRGNPYVELAHWLHILLQDPRNDVGMIRTRFAIDDAVLARDTVAALDAFTPSHLEWELEVELDEREARPARLDGRTRMGWTSWMAPTGAGGVRAEARLGRSARRIA